MINNNAMDKEFQYIKNIEPAKTLKDFISFWELKDSVYSYFNAFTEPNKSILEMFWSEVLMAQTLLVKKHNRDIELLIQLLKDIEPVNKSLEAFLDNLEQNKIKNEGGR